ncbi:MAG: hypothetical protein QM770_14710 [Tepidisphaeraceae bacterium]
MRWIVLAFLSCLIALSSSTRADLPAGLTFDDGFTWIQCHQFDSVEDNKSIGRWVPEVNLRILGSNIPARSGFKMIVKKDGKAVVEYVHDGYPVSLARQAPVGMCIVGWWNATPKLDVDGLLDFEIYYIDGQTDQEHLAKTLKVDIRKVEVNRGGVGSREPGPSQFYVNRHGEVLSTILYFRQPEFPSYTGIEGLDYYSDRVVELLLNYSENEDFAGPAQGRLKIEVDGKPLDMTVPNNTVIQDDMGFGEQAGKFNVEHSDRNAKKHFEGGPPYKERVGFSRRVMILPLHWGPKGNRPPSRVFASDYPGEWKVTYLIDRKPVRIWRFTVGKDGLPVQHAEQAAGLTLMKNAVLIETEIPGEGGAFDGRLTNEFVKQGAFFGRPWSTDAMKALADKVPAKGTPFPVPSVLEQ